MSRYFLPEHRSDYPASPFFPSFQKEMNRLFDQFRRGFPVPDTVSEAGISAPIMPAIDVVERGGTIEISAEVPGVKEENIEVTLRGDVLILKGEKSSEHEKGDEDYHLIERQYGSFRRQIPLGFTPGDADVEAHFEDGILKVQVEKPKSADERKININKS